MLCAVPNIRWLLWLLALIAASSYAGATERVALVIGNGTYAHASYLSNPINDID